MALLIPVEEHRVCQCGPVSPKYSIAFLRIRGIIGHDVWSGCVAAFQTGVDYNIQMAGGFRNALFGGEGLFLATLTGPGKVYLQTLPFSRPADRIVVASRTNKGESSGFAGIGGSVLGGLLGGDRS